MAILSLLRWRNAQTGRLQLAGCALFIAAWGLTGLNANAQDTTADSGDTQIVHIAARHDVLPYVAQNGEAGVEIELVKAIFAGTGYEPHFIQLPRVRMLQSFNAEQVDGVLTQNLELRGKGCITNWYIRHQNVGITVSDRNVPLNSLADMERLSVVSFDGATRYLGADFAIAAKMSPRYTESSDQSTHISLIYNGNFDVVIGDEWILKMAQVERRELTGEFEPLTVHRIIPPTLYGARFHDPLVCDAFDKSLTNMRTTGAYDAIVDAHYSAISAQISVYEHDTAKSSSPGIIRQ